jgi:predicted dehydrogenase
VHFSFGARDLSGFQKPDRSAPNLKYTRQPPVTIEDGYRILQIIDAAYESSRTGRRIALA